ncbi:Uncharacterized protein FWK35_00006070 [Aphis craccivora]|uniref:Uncharacterized protein n=1 Tax=Aphis craccivora TaxID=307492 RepID=A0A6G0ZQ23_APHCR|nr:Uncharacterized protein FWK35_00006070 [Aphis craccivora]
MEENIFLEGWSSVNAKKAKNICLDANSEWSDECIDFILQCFNAKCIMINESSWCIREFSKALGKTQKNYGKSFGVLDQIDFLYSCNSKTNHCKYLKFSPNFYVSVIYTQLNFQKILTFFDVNKKILDGQINFKI